MYYARTLSSSVNDSCLVSELTPNNEYDTSTIKKNVKLAWVGDFQSIKCLVNEYLELEGEWVSPGGEEKVFFCGNVPTITWLSKRKLLQIDGPI